jgi:hypothetical protein
MSHEPKNKRVRKKSLAIQLRVALDHARQELETKDRDELSISRIKLAQTLVVTLNKALSRERIDRAARLKAEVARLESENQSLKQQLSAVTVKPLSDIERALQQYENSKKGGHTDEV